MIDPDPASVLQASDRLVVEDWGVLQYAEALERQKTYLHARKRGELLDTLALLEHPAVYTLGSRKGAERHVVWDDTQRAEAAIDLIKTNRGGDVTYHGPGQIVGYLFVDVGASRDLHRVLRGVESYLIRVLARLGLETGRREGKTGIWIGERKIAAIGLACSRWVTYHGFSLNVCPDLNHFSGIVPCGITDGTVTSLALEQSAEAASLAAVKAILSDEFTGLLDELI